MKTYYKDQTPKPLLVFCGILKTRDDNAWKFNCEQAVAKKRYMKKAKRLGRFLNSDLLTSALDDLDQDIMYVLKQLKRILFFSVFSLT